MWDFGLEGQKVLWLGQNGRQCDHFTVEVRYHVKCVILLSSRSFPLSPWNTAWMSTVSHISHGCHCWIASLTFCGLVHRHPTCLRIMIGNLPRAAGKSKKLESAFTGTCFRCYSNVYSPILSCLWNILSLVVFISVLGDLSTMIRRDGVSLDLASHPSIFPGHPQHPVIIHTPATHTFPPILVNEHFE